MNDKKTDNTYYTITEAAKKLSVEPHVLRYWEEELGLVIKRNDVGHRYYDEEDIALFERIQELKHNGKSLKNIKEAIDLYKKTVKVNGKEKLENTEKTEGKKEEEQKRELSEDSKNVDLSENVVDFKQAQMQKLMSKMIANALQENKHIITSSVKAEVTEEVMKQMDIIMKEKEEREEARFRKLDECLRKLQRGNDEVAATRIKKRWRSKR